MNIKSIISLICFSCLFAPETKKLRMSEKYPDYTQSGFAVQGDCVLVEWQGPDDDRVYQKLTQEGLKECFKFGKTLPTSLDSVPVEIYVDEGEIFQAFVPDKIRYDVLLAFLKHVALAARPGCLTGDSEENIVMHIGKTMLLPGEHPDRMIKIPRPGIRIGISVFANQKEVTVTVLMNNKESTAKLSVP